MIFNKGNFNGQLFQQQHTLLITIYFHFHGDILPSSGETSSICKPNVKWIQYKNDMILY